MIYESIRGGVKGIAKCFPLDWISNVFAAIVSYDITVSSNSWSSSLGALPYGVAAQPTFTGTLAVDNTLSGRAALADFNMVTGSRTWTEAMVGGAYVGFDSQGNLASSLFSISAPGEGESVLFTTYGLSGGSMILREPSPFPPTVEMISCTNCVSLSPTTNTTTPLAPFPTQNLKVTGPLYPPSSLLNPEYALSFDGTAFTASFDLGFYGADPGAALINTWTMGIEDTWSNKYYIHDGNASYPLLMEANLSFNNPEADFQIEVRNELADTTGNWPELRETLHKCSSCSVI